MDADRELPYMYTLTARLGPGATPLVSNLNQLARNVPLSVLLKVTVMLKVRGILPRYLALHIHLWYIQVREKNPFEFNWKSRAFHKRFV